MCRVLKKVPILSFLLFVFLYTQKLDCRFVILQNVSYMLQAVVYSGVRTLAQQMIQNIAKISSSVLELHRGICELHSIISSKVNKTFKISEQLLIYHLICFIIFK